MISKNMYLDFKKIIGEILMWQDPQSINCSRNHNPWRWKSNTASLNWSLEWVPKILTSYPNPEIKSSCWLKKEEEGIWSINQRNVCSLYFLDFFFLKIGGTISLEILSACWYKSWRYKQLHWNWKWLDCWDEHE